MSAAVEFRNVSIVFGDRPQDALPLMDKGMSRSEVQSETSQVLGVHDCTLSVEEGNILVLMGLSGSGKSTLLRAVNGLNRVARGEVMVRTGDTMVDVTSARPRLLRKIRRKHVAMVFQQFGLLPWRTVRENVGLGLELGGMRASKRKAKVEEQLELVGLSDWADRTVGELSGGMQQRVGLARAFATEAPILLMDEPFSALDPLIRSRLQDELLDLQSKLKRTIIFVSHDLDEAFKIGNHIAIMEGGRISQSGTPAEIFAAPADEYVADFVAHMNPLGVLTARDVMEGSPLQTPDHSVEATATIQDVIELITGPASPLAVVENGERIGVVTRASILRGLVNRNAKASTLPPRSSASPDIVPDKETAKTPGPAAVVAAASVAALGDVRPTETLERKIPVYEPEPEDEYRTAAVFYPKDDTRSEAPVDVVRQTLDPDPVEEPGGFEEPVTFRLDERLVDYADELPEATTDTDGEPEDVPVENLPVEDLPEVVTGDLEPETSTSDEPENIRVEAADSGTDIGDEEVQDVVVADGDSEPLLMDDIPEFVTVIDEDELLADTEDAASEELDNAPDKKERRGGTRAKQLSLTLNDDGDEIIDFDLNEDELLEQDLSDADGPKDRPEAD